MGEYTTRRGAQSIDDTIERFVDSDQLQDLKKQGFSPFTLVRQSAMARSGAVASLLSDPEHYRALPAGRASEAGICTNGMTCILRRPYQVTDLEGSE